MLEKWLGITIVVTNLFSQCWPPNWIFDIDFLKNKYCKSNIHVTKNAIIGITILCYFIVLEIMFKRYCRTISHAVQMNGCRR